MVANLNVNQETGQANVVSYRESMWHGQGLVVQEQMSDEDILRLAGMDWQVTEEPIYRGKLDPAGGALETTQISGHKLLVRGDTDQSLAVVSDNYRVFQNSELVQLMRRLASATDSPLVWETAGLLGPTGQTAWCQAKLPDLKIELGNDLTEFFWLIRNGHGNSLALTLMPTLVRVVCQNTETAATGGARGDKQRLVSTEEAEEQEGQWSMPRLAQGFSVMHSGGLDQALDSIVKSYAIAAACHEQTRQVFEQLANVSVTDTEAAEYWEEIFRLPCKEDESQRSRTMRENKERDRRQALSKIWDSPTNKGLDTQDTAFTAFQAAVEYVDHEIYARNNRTRFNSAVSGRGSTLKRDAWSFAGDMFLAPA